jgi:hypothetical protein
MLAIFLRAIPLRLGRIRDRLRGPFVVTIRRGPFAGMGFGFGLGRSDRDAVRRALPDGIAPVYVVGRERA